mmetsp:Transcript_18398/g.35819  ORF Transcript_18398/g.35819 Transcript_18398/m.35819 type:complete len:512 (+) Transcript_18398:301-1836(+)
MAQFTMTLLLPTIVKDNMEVASFLALLSYILFLVNWLFTTDFVEKLHLCSASICAVGLFYLHYSEVVLLATYEGIFVAIWLTLLWYHASTWQNNYRRVCEELNRPTVMASMRPYQGSVFRFFIVVPVSKNSANQWNAPPWKNTPHVGLVLGYSILLWLHIVPFFTPMHCLSAENSNNSLSMFGKLSLLFNSNRDFHSSHSSSLLCCRYNYAMSGFQTHEVQRNYCSGRVRIAFAGSWSTGKTYLLGGLLGHTYSTAQSAPAPTTDKFVCIAAGAPYSDPIRSDDYEQRRHCEIMEHVNDVVRSKCGGNGMPNVLDVADVNQEFSDFVFFDMIGWQTEYSAECNYRTFFHQLIDKVDFTYVVWDVNHGKIDDQFAEFFQNKARGVNYELIYNRFTKDTSNMAFLNQQYAKMSTGQEILSQMYTTKVHENNTQHALQFQDDILHLISKIKSVNQTVHDNRKKTMKENLKLHRDKITGMNSLRRLKICDRLIEDDLNLHVKPKTHHLKWLGLEL